jgi:nitroreductase
MDVLEAIYTRRSIRKYGTAPISQKDIDLILKAAMYAPSAHNYQPWQFIVIHNKSILNAIRKIHPYADMLKNAGLAIVVCGDYTLDKHIGYLVQACSAATQNILLAAHGLDLGAVWLGVYPRENRIKRIAKLLSLPKDLVPISIVSIGIPAEQKEIKDRFKTERIHLNNWSKKVDNEKKLKDKSK